jgi:glycosyltransferase involved in cell wall biosynthesis
VQASFAVSVVIASHGRPVRLRWLLNALEDQTLASDRWETIVVHDYPMAVTERVIRQHPLHEEDRLREKAILPGTGSPARQRNIGWQMAEGERIAFIDDDCRPEADWLATLLEEAQRAPDAIVQGTTRPDPLESAILAAPHVRTMFIDPVGPFAQTCNILYPHRLLQQLDGFDETAITGEDVELSLRARALGVAVVPAAEAVVNHAVESHTLPGIVRQNLKWRHLAYLAKQHPELRASIPLRVFWDGDHLWTTLALLGLVGRELSPWLLTLSVPYILRAAGRRGSGGRQVATALAEVPGQAIRQAAEVAGLIAGSLRHRTVLL